MKYKNEDKKERRKVENPQNHMGVDLAGILGDAWRAPKAGYGEG